MADYENWLVKREEDVFWMLLNRPNKKNAFNRPLVEELQQILLAIGQDESLRAAVIGTVTDEVFSAGADIDTFATLKTDHDGRQFSIQAQHVFKEVERLPIPVIAAVRGLNLTAGFELMLCCDLIIAADNVRLGQIETRYALTPFGGGTQRLTRLVGPLRARELIYTARIIEADEALRIGLVNEVVPLKELDNRVREICRTIGKSTRRAIRRSKFLIEMATYVNDRGFSYESQIAGEDFASGEPLEKFMEFISREKKS